MGRLFVYCLLFTDRFTLRRKEGFCMTLSEVLLLLTLLWNVIKGTFDIVMKFSDKEHDNKKD